MLRLDHILFYSAGLLVLALIMGSLYIPPAIILGLPALLLFWMVGMVIFGLILWKGVQIHDS